MPPRVPEYNQSQVGVSPLSVPRMSQTLQPSPLQYAGAGLEDAATAYGKLQEAAIVAESGRVQRETSAELHSAVKHADATYQDPFAFEQSAKDAIQEIRKNRLESASNGRVRQRVQDQIGDDLILRAQDIETIKLGKMRKKAIGDWTTMKVDGLQQYAASEDPVDRTRIATQLGQTLKELSDNNLMDYDDKQKELTIITGHMGEADIRRDFKGDPIGTLQRIEAGAYSRRVAPDKLEEIKTHLATSYRTAQADITRKVKEDQENNFADAMVQARQPNGISQATIDVMSAKRQIDAQQAVHLFNQMHATQAAGGVMYSNPSIHSDFQYRLHVGRLSANEIRAEQQNGNLTIGDANTLYAGVEARARRDHTQAMEIGADARAAKADARQAIIDARNADVSNDLNYKRAEQFIRHALPNVDRLDLDHSLRIMAGQAIVDFDDAARAKDADGKPKYKPQDLQKVADNIVEGALIKMDLQANAARAKLLPGIKTAEDVSEAVRQRRISPADAKEQMRLLITIGAGSVGTASPVQSSTPTPGLSRDQAAREKARAGGAK